MIYQKNTKQTLKLFLSKENSLFHILQLIGLAVGSTDHNSLGYFLSPENDSYDIHSLFL